MAMAHEVIGTAPGALPFAEEEYRERRRRLRERIPTGQVWRVGHTCLANDGVERCSWLRGYFSNYENVFGDPAEGFAVSCIDTIAMTEAGLEVLPRVPCTLSAAAG